MAYHSKDPYNEQTPTQSLPSSTQYGSQYPTQQSPRPTQQSPRPASNEYGAYNGNTYRSNGTNAPFDGVHQHRPPIPPSQTQQRAFAVAIPAPPTTVHSLGNTTSNGYSSGQNTPRPLSQAPPLDYQLLLLSLAEEYFAAAYGLGSMADIARRETEMQSYYKLMTTGLGCLEAVLKHFKMQPEREATVRLRYAAILFEETENIMEAEEALGKGIVLCDRHRFFDHKYNMQHLLARILFSRAPRAAFKFLDGISIDCEAYQHIAWVYAFRFLKVAMHLELSSHQDLFAALNLFKGIISLSSTHGDKAILATAMTLEALICIRISNNAEYVEEAQRALAGVRSLQLDPSMGELHHLTVLVSFVDLCCQLQQFTSQQAVSKMDIMEKALKTVHSSSSWTDEGNFGIPMALARMPSCNSQTGIIRRTDDNSIVLMFKWMPKEDIYSVGYLLSAASLANRNTVDGQKSEHMLEEGIERLEWAQQENSKLPKSITLAFMQQNWRKQMVCYMRLYLAFNLCARTSWPAAKEQQAKVDASLESMSDTPEPLLVLTLYLRAVVYQGTGNLTEALSLYRNSLLALPAPSEQRSRSQIRLDVSILSTLNAILIIRSPYHPQNHLVSSLVSELEPLCLQNQNHEISAAYHLVVATTTSDTILLMKQSLETALKFSQETKNKHLTCICLNFMSWKFFRGVVGKQAQRSAQASNNLANQSMNGLWISVSAGLRADTLEVAGLNKEAEKYRKIGEKASASLPQALQEAVNQDFYHHVPLKGG